MCYRCVAKPESQLRLDKDGEWTAKCVECQNEYPYSKVEDTYNGYICNDCGLSNGFTPSNGSYGGKYDMKACDFCLDVNPISDMISVNSYTLCAYCESLERKHGTISGNSGVIQVSGGEML